MVKDCITVGQPHQRQRPGDTVAPASGTSATTVTIDGSTATTTRHRLGFDYNNTDIHHSEL